MWSRDGSACGSDVTNSKLELFGATEIEYTNEDSFEVTDDVVFEKAKDCVLQPNFSEPRMHERSAGV